MTVEDQESSGNQTSAATGPEPLDFDDIRRCAVLYCDWRTGSNLFKTTLADIGGIQSSLEIFNSMVGLKVGYSFAAYTSLQDVDTRTLLQDPEANLPGYFAFCFQKLPKARPMILDLKYAHSYRLGIDDTLHAPLVLKKLVDWDVPVIHLVRRDVVSMALSQQVALQTGVFSKDIGHGDVEKERALEQRFWLDPRVILNSALASRVGQNTAFDVLNRLGARSMTIFYEDIVSENWAAQYRRCFRFLDHYSEVPQTFQPRLERLNSARRVANLDEILTYVADADSSLLQSYPSID